MTDHNTIFDLSKDVELPDELKDFFNKTQAALKGDKRRLFMARATALFGNGGHMRAERELGWDRGIIRKGTKELQSGISCIDNFSGRGRHSVEKYLPNLLQDLRDIVEPISQADPTFRTTNEYSPITAPEVRRRLIKKKSYTDEKLPSVRTIQKKLNNLNFHIQKVQKCEPKKNSGTR
jgi:hypothetical protein